MGQPLRVLDSRKDGWACWLPKAEMRATLRSFCVVTKNHGSSPLFVRARECGQRSESGRRGRLPQAARRVSAAVARWGFGDGRKQPANRQTRSPAAAGLQRMVGRRRLIGCVPHGCLRAESRQVSAKTVHRRGGCSLQCLASCRRDALCEASPNPIWAAEIAS